VKIEVRAANTADIDWLVTQLECFSRFQVTKRKLFTADHARLVIHTMINDHLVLVAESQSRGLMGFIGAYLHPHLFDPTLRMLSEAFWWVAEEFRRTRAGFLLLDTFTEYGKANADWTVITLQGQSLVSGRHLIRRGFVAREQLYLLEGT